jgi:hypothetical protein
VARLTQSGTKRSSDRASQFADRRQALFVTADQVITDCIVITTKAKLSHAQTLLARAEPKSRPSSTLQRRRAPRESPLPARARDRHRCGPAGSVKARQFTSVSGDLDVAIWITEGEGFRIDSGGTLAMTPAGGCVETALLSALRRVRLPERYSSAVVHTVYKLPPKG